MGKNNKKFTQKEKAKIILLFPPVFRPFQPYLSLPSLTAFLKKEGHKVIQKDINVEAYDRLLTKERLQKSFDIVLKKFIELKNKKKLKNTEAHYYTELSKVIIDTPYVIKNIEKAKGILRDKDKFYDIRKYRKSKTIILDGLRLLSAEYYPSKITLEGYGMNYLWCSTKGIIRAISDANTNLFLSYFREYVVPDIMAQDPDLIGLSIVGQWQIIPAFTLASLIKQKIPGVHITAGGPMVSLFIDELKKSKEFFSIIDSFIVYEGETALLKLAEQVKGNRNMGRVPNLIYYKQGKIHFNNSIFVEDINSLPAPCYDGLPLDLYLSPKPVLSIQPARGCYWRRCAFCNNFKVFSKYNIRKTRLLIEDVRYLAKRHNTKYFAFANESIGPRQLDEISSSLIRNNINIKWYCGMRFEEDFTSQLCRLIKKAGCQKILFGLESGCQRILDLMEKGTKKEIIQNILNYCYDEKIAVHLYALIGFPTETANEAEETLNFILNNKKILNHRGFSYLVSTFQLKGGSKVDSFPARYGVEIVVDKDMDVWPRFHYKIEKGMSMEGASKMSSFIHNRLFENFNRSFLDAPISHSLLYLSPNFSKKDGEFYLDLLSNYGNIRKGKRNEEDRFKR